MMPSRKLLFLLFILHFHCFNSQDLNGKISEIIFKAAFNVLNRHHAQVKEVKNSEDWVDQLHNSSFSDHHRSGRAARSVPASYAFPQVPVIGLNPGSFAHEYVPQTGVANREALMITGIKEERIGLIIPTPTSLAFRYARFNSSNHLLSHQRFYVNIWRFNPERGLNFDARQSLCQIDSRYEGQVLLAELFTQTHDHSETLNLALVIETPNNGIQLRTYEVGYFSCQPLKIVELKRRPVKLSFMSSHHASAIVVLSEGIYSEMRIESSRPIRGATSVIEVSVKNPIDLEAFVIDGQSFVAAASSHAVDILRFNEFLDYHAHYDSLRISAVTDIALFQMGFDYFLGVSTMGSGQYLYEWKDASFRWKQTLAVTRSSGWKLIDVPSCRDDYIVALLRPDPAFPVILYVWDVRTRTLALALDNFKRFVPSFNYELNPKSLTSVPFNNSGHLFALDGAGRPHVYSFQTILQPVVDPVYTTTENTSALMRGLLGRIDGQEKYVLKLESTLRYAVRPSGDVHLSHPTNFRDLSSTAPSVINAVRGLQYFALQGSPISLGDLGFKPTEISSGLAKLSHSIASVKSQLGQIAFKNQPTVMSGKNIVTGVAAYAINSSALTVGVVNGQVMTKLLNSIYRLGQMPLVGGKKFFDTLHIERNLFSRINGIDLSKAALVDQAQRFTSPIVFGRLNVRNNLAVSSVNNLDLNKDLVRADHGSFSISSPTTFSGPALIIQNLLATQISGVDITQLSRTTLRINVDQAVTSPLLFNQAVSVNDISHNGRTNGVSLKQLEHDLVLVNRPAIITGRKLFVAPFTARDDLDVSGRLCGLRIPEDLFLASVPQVITGYKRLVGQHRFDAPVAVGLTVNGLKLPGDVVTLSGNDPIPFIKLAKGIDIFGNVAVKGRVDGVDISEMARMSVKGADETLQNAIFHGPVFVKGSLICPSCYINGVRLSALARDAIIRGSSEPVLIHGRKEIRSVVFGPDISVGRINAIDLNDIATTNRHEVISRLTMMDAAFTNVSIRHAMIGNVNMMNLHLSHISLSNPGFIEGGKYFMDSIVIQKDLSVTGMMSGVFPNRDLVLKRGNQVISGNKIFSGGLTVAGSLMAHGQMVASGLLDGVNITKLNLLRISLNSQQITRMTVKLAGTKARSIFSTNINNLDLRRFIPDILLKSTGHQIITGNKQFLTTHVFNDISTVAGINNIKLYDVNAMAVLLRGNTTITVPLNMNSNFKTGHVILYGKVNGIDLQRLASDSLTTIGRAVMSGYNTFTSELEIVGDLNVDAVNGLFLPTSVFLKTGNQVVRGPLIFMKTVSVLKNLNVVGAVNSLDIVRLDRSIMMINRPNIVIGNLVFTDDIRVLGDIRVKGAVNDVKLATLVRRTLLKFFDQTISGSKTILGPVTSGGSDLGLRLLNNVSFSGFIHDIVFINKKVPVNVPSFKVFLAPVKLAKNLVHGDRNTAVQSVNGVNLASLYRSAVPLNRASLVNGHKIFDSSLVISKGSLQVGRFNGLNLATDVLFAENFQGKKIQVVKGRKVLSSAHCLRNIDVRGLVNGISLASLARDTLFKDGRQTAMGKKIFHGRFMVMNHVNARRLNSMSDVSRELVTLSGNQKFSGEIVFSKTLFVAGNVLASGRIAGINMTDLVLHSMYKDVNQIITSPMTFDSVFFGTNVSAAGPVNGVKLNLLSQDVSGFRTTLRITDEMIRNVMTNQLKRTTRCYEQLLTNPFKIDKLVLIQQLPKIFGGSYEIGESPKNGPLLSEYDASSGNSTVHKLVYDVKARRWVPLSPIRNAAASKVTTFTFKKAVVSIKQFPTDSERKTEILVKNKVIAHLDQFVDVVSVAVGDNIVFISELIGIEGKVKVFTIQVVAGVLKISNVAVLNVGPSATDLTSFMINKDLYLAVSRNFRSECSVKDFGSLIFTMVSGSGFQLVQRIPVDDANHVRFYEMDGQHYLVLDDQKILNPSIKVFRRRASNRCQFELFQTLESGPVKDMIVINFGTSQMSKLLVTVSDTQLVVRKHSGHSGFSESWTATLDGGVSIQAWLTNDDRLHLIVGQSKKSPGSLIFEIVTKGSTLLPITFKSYSHALTGVYGAGLA